MLAALVLSALLSVKDPPPPMPPPPGPMPEAMRHPYVYIKGYRQKLYVPYQIMIKHGLLPEQVLDIDQARQIAREMGAVYPDDILEKLQQFDEHDPQP